MNNTKHHFPVVLFTMLSSGSNLSLWMKSQSGTIQAKGAEKLVSRTFGLLFNFFLDSLNNTHHWHFLKLYNIVNVCVSHNTK